MKLLWTEWARRQARWKRARNRLLLLDYDGTLAPIVASHRRAKMARGLRAMLARLRTRPRTRVAVLSGRALNDVRARVDVPGLYYGGNHGLEMAGPRFSFRHSGAERRAAHVVAAARAARAAFRGVPGIRVEGKGLSLSIHHREVRAGRIKEVERIFRRFRRTAPAADLRWRGGARVWEGLPRVAWDKGRAAALLLRHLGRPFSIAVGDDRTDEDMFRAVGRRGVTVSVGRRPGTRARFFVRRQEDVPRLLRSLADETDRRSE